MTRNQIKRKFLKQAKIGNGKAYSIFTQNKGVDFTDEIIDISIHNYGYDPQCEGDRADYALQFIRELEEKQKQKVLAAIKNQLAQVQITDDWDVDQLFKLAALFSKEYDSEFGEILRKRFDTCSRDELWQFPKSAFLMLDGFDGMVHLARRIGKILLTDEDWWEDVLKLKLQYFGHLMQRVDSLEKTLMLGGVGGRRRRGRQRMRWLDGITDSMDVSVNSGSWRWTGRPGVLRFMGSQRVGHD